MAFTVKIDNLGKLNKATVTVGGLTVLAGPNATGKSFFSKMLYSVFGAMNANHALMYIQAMMEPLNNGLRQMKRFASESSDLTVLPAAHLQKLVEICESIGDEEDEFFAVSEVHEELVAAAQRAVDACEALHPAVDALLKNLAENKAAYLSSRISFDGQMGKGINNLKSLAKSDPDEIISRGFMQTLDRNLLGNFQISASTELKGNTKHDTSIEVKGVATIHIEEGGPRAVVSPDAFARLQRHSGVIYLESAAHWKLRGALNAAKGAPRFLGQAEYLDVPKYFYDLDIELGRKRAGEVAFPDLLAHLTGKDVLGGKIAIDEGAFAFVEHDEESGRSFSLPLAATGAVNLGILALLIERKILDKETFLFIDEPESNLHPAWQAEMITALLELAQGGVNVVIATHSSDIIERLLGLIKKHPEAEQLIALNHFSRDGVKNGDLDLHEKMNAILEDLTDAFSDSYMMSEGL